MQPLRSAMKPHDFDVIFRDISVNMLFSINFYFLLFDEISSDNHNFLIPRNDFRKGDWVSFSFIISSFMHFQAKFIGEG